MDTKFETRSIKWYRLYNMINKANILHTMIAIYLITNGYSFTDVALMTSIMLISKLMLSIPVGILGDKYDQQKLLYIGNTLKSLMFLFLFLGSTTLIYVAWALAGIGTVWVEVIEDSMIHSYCEDKKRDYKAFRGILKSDQVVSAIVVNYILAFLYIFIEKWIFLIFFVYILSSNIFLHLSGVNGKKRASLKTFSGVIRDVVLESKSNKGLLRKIFIGASFIATITLLMKLETMNISLRGINGGMVGILNNTAQLSTFLFLKWKGSSNIKSAESMVAYLLTFGLIANILFEGYLGLLVLLATPITFNMYKIYNVDYLGGSVRSDVKSSIISLREMLVALMSAIFVPIITYAAENRGMNFVSVILLILIWSLWVIHKHFRKTDELKLVETLVK